MVSGLSELIVHEIELQVANVHTATKYREPLVAFADASDPLFGQMKQILGERALLPSDLLPGAKTVVSFFVPYTEELVQLSRQAEYVAREWAVAYIETNQLFNDIGHHLEQTLASLGVQAVSMPATHNFDTETLTSLWSHKSVAYIAGLGTFGVHQMLITAQGTAGRLGSLVISQAISPTKRPEQELCLYRRNGSCLVCVANCPVQALSNQGFDRRKCFQRVMEVDAYYPDLALCDVCGKCALGPCALGSSSYHNSSLSSRSQI